MVDKEKLDRLHNISLDLFSMAESVYFWNLKWNKYVFDICRKQEREF